MLGGKQPAVVSASLCLPHIPPPEQVRLQVPGRRCGALSRSRGEAAPESLGRHGGLAGYPRPGCCGKPPLEPLTRPRPGSSDLGGGAYLGTRGPGGTGSCPRAVLSILFCGRGAQSLVLTSPLPARPPAPSLPPHPPAAPPLPRSLRQEDRHGPKCLLGCFPSVFHSGCKLPNGLGTGVP